MALALLALAASCVTLALPWLGSGELALQGGRASAWVLLPWIALAGLPRRAAGPTSTWIAAVLLPLVALGAAADLRAERGALEVAGTAATGLVLALLLAAAARRARGARGHAFLWLALVPGAAAVCAAADIAGWEGLRRAAAATPLAWGARSAAGASDARPWAALAIALALAASAARTPRAEAEGP